MRSRVSSDLYVKKVISDQSEPSIWVLKQGHFPQNSHINTRADSDLSLERSVSRAVQDLPDMGATLLGLLLTGDCCLLLC